MGPIHDSRRVALGAACALLASTMLGTPWRAARAADAGCVKVSEEARYRGYGYDHVVVLQNTCPQPQRCKVSTNVNPKAIAVALPKGARKEVVTFRGSPSRDFSAAVQCRPEP